MCSLFASEKHETKKINAMMIITTKLGTFNLRFELGIKSEL